MKKAKCSIIKFLNESYSVYNVPPDREEHLRQEVLQAEQQILALKEKHPNLSPNKYMGMYILWRAEQFAEQQEMVQKKSQKLIAQLQIWEEKLDNTLAPPPAQDEFTPTEE